MKKILALITLIISISSCDKPSPNNDSYYVQYNAQIHTMYYGDIVDISMNGPSRYLGGNKTFSVTYGPVKKDSILGFLRLVQHIVVLQNVLFGYQKIMNLLHRKLQHEGIERQQHPIRLTIRWRVS